MIYEWFKLDVRIYYLQYYARSFSNFLSAKQYQLSCYTFVYPLLV